MRLDIQVSLKAEVYAISLDLATTAKSGGRIWKEWTFIGATYDPSTSKFYCILDDQLMELQAQGKTKSGSSTVTFNTEQNRVFLLDDIIYIPTFSNQDAVNVLYNQSK